MLISCASQRGDGGLHAAVQSLQARVHALSRIKPVKAAHNPSSMCFSG
jgi:hypothetical protein